MDLAKHIADALRAAVHECPDPTCDCDPAETVYATQTTLGQVMDIEAPVDLIARIAADEMVHLATIMRYRPVPKIQPGWQEDE